MTWRDRLARAVFEVYLFAVCVLVGVLGLAFPAARARSLITAFPGWAQVAWYVALLLGGVLSILGIARGADLGLLVERAALVILAGLCLSFGIAAFAFSGASAVSGGLMLAGFGIACLVRARQITTDLAQLRATLRARTAAAQERLMDQP